MGSDSSAINRRQVMQGLGGVAATSALPPWLVGAALPPKPSNVLSDGQPGDVNMSADRVEDVFARVARRVNDGLFPGATALIARHGVIVGKRAFGTKVAGASEPVTVDTLFDLESMTKVVATAASVMVLAQQNQISLNDKVANYLPAFAANGKNNVTIRDMLRYSSGLPIDNQALDNPDQAAVWLLMQQTPLEYPTGSMVEYSDLTYRLLGKLVEAVSGKTLDKYAHDHIWAPLGMKDTMFNPPAALLPRIAATGYSERRGYVVRGEVQDEQDFALGGICGCDGVFSTVKDLAIFCQMLLNGGNYGGVQVLSLTSVLKMVQNQTPQVNASDTDMSPITNLVLTPKGYGFEIATSRFSPGGMRLSPISFGKTGGAGTYMWIDPVRHVFGILLTNHGLPTPFDEPGYDEMLDGTAPAEFFDGIINAINDA